MYFLHQREIIACTCTLAWLLYIGCVQKIQCNAIFKSLKHALNTKHKTNTSDCVLFSKYDYVYKCKMADSDTD